MFKAIRPKKDDNDNPTEQVDCPVCGSGYIKKSIIIPHVYNNFAVEIYECTNQHSWKKYPKGIPIHSNPNQPLTITPPREEPFQNVYRPLQDTQELQTLR